MTEIQSLLIEEYLDKLASKQATPGGGSAAALMGAQGAALVSMVCQLTIGKPKYAEVDAQMRDLLEKSEYLRHQLFDMIRADIEVFDKLMACYSLPKVTDEEKTHRAEQIQWILKQATQVPLDCATACVSVISLCRIAAENGSLGVISDAGVGVMSAFAGLKSAVLNVNINLSSIKDVSFVESKTIELNALLAGVESEVQSIYSTVQSRL